MKSLLQVGEQHRPSLGGHAGESIGANTEKGVVGGVGEAALEGGDLVLASSTQPGTQDASAQG